MNWLPDLSAWTPADFSAASSVGTLLVAIVAAAIALRQIVQARQLREEEAAPAIVVDVLPSPVASNLLNLIIVNVGKTPARDVRIVFDPAIDTALDVSSNYKIARWSVLTEGIKTLVPGRRITALFDDSVQRHEAKLPLQYNVTITCRDWRGRVQPAQQYTLDLSPIYGGLHADEMGIHQLVKEVEKLRNAVEPLGKTALTVEVYDGEAMEAKREATHRE